MSDIPGGSAPGGNDPAQRGSGAGKDEVQAWVEWFQHAAVTAGDLVKLASLELRLAATDAPRLLVLVLAALPIALLAWIGLSVLLAWLAFYFSHSVTLGLGVFLVIQVVTLLVMAKMIIVYSRSLSLPATRKHLKAMREEAEHGAQTTD